MATFDYSAAAAKAKAIIEKFGGNGSFVIKGNDGGFDDDGNALAAQADTVISGTVTPLLQYKSMEIDGSTIQTGDSYVFFDSVLDVPVGAVTTINGDSFRVVNSNELKSVNNIKILQKIQLRR